MATISERFSRFKLRSVLAFCYTLGFTLVVGLAFVVIYQISERYRADEFSLRLKDRTLTTFTVLLQVDQINRDMLQLFDKNTINSLSEEKILLFDSSGSLIYSSIDDTRINYPAEILGRLRSGETEINLAEGKYDLVGISFKSANQSYYGIAKAFDRFGKSKLSFLKIVLVISFFIVAATVFGLSLLLAKIITAPITGLTNRIGTITPEDLSIRLPEPRATREVQYLASRFNDLLDKVEEAFRFQHHFIHHVSHELKTPLAVMMANAERALGQGGQANYESSLEFQKNGLMELSHIITAMMELSKAEHHIRPIQVEAIRLDELLFACIDELNYLYRQVQFDFQMDDSIEDSENLTVFGSSRMLKMAVMNVLKNALLYADRQKPVAALLASTDAITLNIINDGPVITSEEQRQLFHHLFRGANSKNVKGFGLGLVLVRRIISLHKGKVSYCILPDGRNCISIVLPVRS